VTGRVTFDGQPVAEGHIRFVHSASDTGAIVEDVGAITAGQYDLQVHPGAKRVEILASREIPPPEPGMFGMREDYIPRRYNAESILRADVDATKTNVFNFDLKSVAP
jgi:hypothetical protein